jgi:hypothetical protein
MGNYSSLYFNALRYGKFNHAIDLIVNIDNSEVCGDFNFGSGRMANPINSSINDNTISLVGATILHCSLGNITFEQRNELIKLLFLKGAEFVNVSMSTSLKYPALNVSPLTYAQIHDRNLLKYLLNLNINLTNCIIDPLVDLLRNFIIHNNNFKQLLINNVIASNNNLFINDHIVFKFTGFIHVNDYDTLRKLTMFLFKDCKFPTNMVQSNGKTILDCINGGTLKNIVIDIFKDINKTPANIDVPNHVYVGSECLCCMEKTDLAMLECGHAIICIDCCKVIPDNKCPYCKHEVNMSQYKIIKFI